MTAPFSMNSSRGKQVLALIRAGDYAHAGEEEAIELTIAAIPKKPDQRTLDAGCGRGRYGGLPAPPGLGPGNRFRRGSPLNRKRALEVSGASFRGLRHRRGRRPAGPDL